MGDKFDHASEIRNSGNSRTEDTSFVLGDVAKLGAMEAPVAILPGMLSGKAVDAVAAEAIMVLATAMMERPFIYK
jgi:hypothetical protein